MGTVYFYKMTSDSGMAPCVDQGVLSLAICKPSIRRRAQEGDIIFGFGGKALGETLIYAAKIGKVVPDSGSSVEIPDR
jgi:Nucleotide modification associated domain 2